MDLIDGTIVSNFSNKDKTVLQDISTTGKERPWKKRKLQADLLSRSYKRLGFDRKSFRVKECGSELRFAECPQGHSRKLIAASFCRVRLCPMCSWRKSLMNAHQVRLVTHEANQRESLRWVFLTLTVRNCEGEELKNELDLMFKAFRRLIERKRFKDATAGYFRALEVVRNDDHESKSYGTYHPHFHVLLAMKPSYFKTGKYIKQSEWTSLWMESLKIDYTPIVHVQIVKPKKGLDDKDKVRALESAIVETAKYPTKFKSVLKEDDAEFTDETVGILDTALHGRRLLGYGGLLKDIWNELKLKGKVADVEDDSSDLLHVDGVPDTCDCPTCGSVMFVETLYKWNMGIGNYIKS